MLVACCPGLLWQLTAARQVENELRQLVAAMEREAQVAKQELMQVRAARVSFFHERPGVASRKKTALASGLLLLRAPIR